MKHLGNEDGKVITLMIDIVFAINLANNSIAHGIRRHIKMKFHYLKELVSERRLTLGYCISEDQLADLLTKGVSIEVFKRLLMGMEDFKELN